MSVMEGRPGTNGRRCAISSILVTVVLLVTLPWFGGWGLCLLLVPVAWRLLPGLLARYDSELLKVTPEPGLDASWQGPRNATQREAWQVLTTWCFAGAGSGASPLPAPWCAPRLECPLSLAVLHGSPGSGKSHLAEALSRQLDGSNLLAACLTRRAGLLLRLVVKGRECLWWRRRQESDPWDSGYLGEAAALNPRLAAFRPRRATLVVADQLPEAALQQAIESLVRASSGFRQPVRLLIVTAVPPDLPAPGRAFLTESRSLALP